MKSSVVWSLIGAYSDAMGNFCSGCFSEKGEKLSDRSEKIFTY